MFANGLRVREIILDIDEDEHRVAWAVVDPANLTHHHASAQVFVENGATRFVWNTDVLPDAAAPAVAGMMEAGLAAVAGRFGRR